jgi:hypothetical protein
LKKTFNFTRGTLNRALSYKAGPFTGPNEFGLFLAKFTTECPYLPGKRRLVWYFYRQVNGKPPADPVSPLDITDELSKSNSLRRDCMRLGRVGDPPLDGNTPERGGGGDPPSDGNTPERGEVDPPLDGNTPERSPSNQHNSLGEVITPCRDQPDAGLDDLPIYWESPEAAKLFGFDYKNGDGDDVFNGLTARVNILTEVLRSSDGYKRVVSHSEENLLPEQIFHIRNKCLYLRTAYTIALNKLGRDSNNWVATCCQEALDLLAGLGFDTTVDAKRISYWNIDFRKDNRFPHPNLYVANGIKPKPPFFEHFPNAAADASTFILDHLDHFSVEMLRGELISKIIPALTKECEDDGIPDDSPERILLSQFEIRPPSYTTVLRWVHYLGFSQDKLKKSYYVDGHEHEEQKKHRSQFTQRYLSDLEPRSHRWVQMSVEKAESIQSSLPANNKLIVTGHKYHDPLTDTECIEFHVDDHDCMQDYSNEMYGAYGGNLSVRRPVDSKPLLIFGQDESIFNQFSFGSKQWVGPSGQRSILPKSTGMGLMISSFQGREVSVLCSSLMMIVVSCADSVTVLIVISSLLYVDCHIKVWVGYGIQ